MSKRRDRHVRHMVGPGVRTIARKTSWVAVSRASWESDYFGARFVASSSAGTTRHFSGESGWIVRSVFHRPHGSGPPSCDCDRTTTNVRNSKLPRTDKRRVAVFAKFRSEITVQKCCHAPWPRGTHPDLADEEHGMSTKSDKGVFVSCLGLPLTKTVRSPNRPR